MKGLGTALITPFTAQNAVDYDALTQLIEDQIAGGVDYLVVLGTTAEAVTLTAQERAEVRTHIAKQVGGRVPLVLGMGGNNTAQVIADIADCDFTPYKAILSVCPYYNKPSQEGLFQHYTAIAKACPIPIILYNVPGRTGVNLLPETVIRIYEACPEKIMGIKEASGNIAQIRNLIDLAQHRFAVISGDDSIAWELMEAGADGLISVASNAFTADFREIVHNERQQGKQLHQAYQPLIRLLFAEGNPTGIKAMLTTQKRIQNYLRLPLVPANKALQEQIQEQARQIHR